MKVFAATLERDRNSESAIGRCAVSPDYTADIVQPDSVLESAQRVKLQNELHTGLYRNIGIEENEHAFCADVLNCAGDLAGLTVNAP